MRKNQKIEERGASASGKFGVMYNFADPLQAAAREKKIAFAVRLCYFKCL